MASSRVPANQTLLMKGLSKTVTRTQVSDFVRSATPRILGVFLTTDLYSEEGQAAQVAFLNYASPQAALDAKTKLEEKVQALKGANSAFARVSITVKSEKSETTKTEGSTSNAPPPIAFAVWVANLVDEDSKQLKDIFEKYGDLATGGYPPVKVFESSNRSAIVNFRKFEDAISLIEVCNKRQLLFGEAGRGRMYATAQPFSNTKYVLNVQNFFKSEKRDIITLKEAEDIAESMGDHKPPRWKEALFSEFEVDQRKQLVCVKGSDALSKESLIQNDVGKDLYEGEANFDPAYLYGAALSEQDHPNVPSPLLSLSGAGSDATKELTQEHQEEEEDYSAILLGTYGQQAGKFEEPRREQQSTMSSMIGPFSAFGPALNPIGAPNPTQNAPSPLSQLNGTALGSHMLLPSFDAQYPFSTGTSNGNNKLSAGSLNGVLDGFASGGGSIEAIVPPPFGPKEGEGNIVQWSVEEVCGFMRRCGFDEGSARANSIDGKTLVDLLHDAEGRALALMPAEQGGLGLRPLQLWRLRTEVKVALSRPAAAASGSGGAAAASHALAVPQQVKILTGSAAPERSGVGIDESLTRDPVTGNVMTDPVTAADGLTYDRSTVESVFLVFGKFPPNAPAPQDTLMVTPNKSVRNLIARLHPEVALAPWRI